MTEPTFEEAYVVFKLFDDALTRMMRERVGDEQFCLSQCDGVFSDPHLVKQNQIGFYCWTRREMQMREVGACFSINGFNWKIVHLMEGLFKLKYFSGIKDKVQSPDVKPFVWPMAAT